MEQERSFPPQPGPAALAAELRALQDATALLNQVDDRDFNERPALLLKWLIRLTVLRGQPSIQIPRQADLGTLINIAPNKVRDVLRELTDAKALLIHRDTDEYEVLVDVWNWKVRDRCQQGTLHALELAEELVQADRRRRSGQRELGELEQSFQPEPTLRQIIGQNARDEAQARAEQSSVESDNDSEHLASRGPGAAESEQPTHPPGTIGTEKPAGARPDWARLRQVIETGERVEETPARPPKVPFKGTFGERPGPKKSLKGNFSSRACASDDPDHPVHPESKQSFSSGSSDEAKPDERCGAEKSRMTLCRADHELLGDIRRRFPNLGHHEWFWREAIACSKEAVGTALDAVKYAGREGHGGGYMRSCFYDACNRLGVVLTDNLRHRQTPKKPANSREGRQ